MAPSQHDPAQPGGPNPTQVLPGPAADGTRRRRYGVRLALAGTAVAAVGVAGVAIANAETSEPTAPASAGVPDRPGIRHRLHGGPLAAGGMFGALHGEAVVAKPGGGYQTIAAQRGEVTAVSASSITVKSQDGFQKTYTVTGDTLVNATRDGIDAIKKGEQAAVIATVAGGKVTATRVVDLAKIKERREQFRKRMDMPPLPG